MLYYGLVVGYKAEERGPRSGTTALVGSVGSGYWLLVISGQHYSDTMIRILVSLTSQVFLPFFTSKLSV